MLWNHIAAIFFLSGPLFYIGLVMMIDPAGIAAIPDMLARGIEEFRALMGLPAQRESVGPGHTGISHTGRRALRLVGLALVVSGMLIAVMRG